ncbi:hypothetical protein GFS24_02985 [Chitinophaga sp. SYP-B3965]|uniref:hypothetical protein n=1 Tax=Chitinophaga sp. SYP-B3965 TaxID=2663120 RepID=UPI001299870F|nr:hypothetical protein [Chitinophaga sp. SYP-B3965]MRG44059.1 hypothetical protein [Chitinophaga sp. SYP-B3965]
MKHLFVILLCFFSFSAVAQRLSPADKATLDNLQDSLRVISYDVINGKEESVREARNDYFIPQLVNALKTKYSFYYPFDSLKTVAKVYPQDSTFRIFTWPLESDNSTFRHFGVIQMNTKDGSVKLFPLFDNSDFSKNTDTVTNNRGWIGCLYYAMVQRHYFNSEFYTLFGWDANSQTSQKKVIEMLTFKNGEPVFGGPFFSFAEDTVPKPGKNRFIIEYKREAVAAMNYDKEMDMIILDHLISETNEPLKKYTYIPDLDYEGFRWKAGKWVHVEKVFHDALQLNKYPVGEPVDKKRSDFVKPKMDFEIQEEEAAKAAEEAAKKAKKKKKG